MSALRNRGPVGTLGPLARGAIRPVTSAPYRRAGVRAAPLADTAPVPIAPGMDEVSEFIVPVDGTPVVPVEVPMDPELVLPLPGGRTTTGDTRGPSFWTSSEHGAVASVDSVVEVQRRSTRSASTPDGLGLGMVWASAEPASRSAASGASETGKDLFMACSFSGCCSGLKSTACRNSEKFRTSYCRILFGSTRTLPHARREPIGTPFPAVSRGNIAESRKPAAVLQGLVRHLTGTIPARFDRPPRPLRASGAECQSGSLRRAALIFSLREGRHPTQFHARQQAFAAQGLGLRQADTARQKGKQKNKARG